MEIISNIHVRRNIFLWVLYDFANSLLSVVFFLYFAQWAVVEQGVSDLVFNLTFTVSTVFLLVAAPIAGFFADRSLRRVTGLRWSTVGTALIYGFVALCAVRGETWWALVGFTLGAFVYQLSFVFYTPLLSDIADEEHRGRVSGYGIAANYLGQFAGLLVALPFSGGVVNLFGGSPRAETLLPAVIIFFLCSLPTLIFFKEPQRETVSASGVGLGSIYTSIKSFFLHSSVALFILSYFLFNDAILTVSNNFSIFLERVWLISDAVKTYILLGVLCSCAVGGVVAGIIADRFGHKRTMVCILAGWIVLLPLVGLIRSFPVFIVATVFMGLWFGASWTVSRSVMAYLAPSGSNNLSFAFFNLIERASSLLGPVAWGLAVGGMVSVGDERYRIAIIAMTVFIVLGLWAMIHVRSDRGVTSPTEPREA